MKNYGRVDVELPAFLTSALGGGEWSASHTGRLNPGVRALGTHWIGGWVGCSKSVLSKWSQTVARHLPIQDMAKKKGEQACKTCAGFELVNLRSRAH
jgi:hypothetical protein